mgnify:CR=1 FL=1
MSFFPSHLHVDEGIVGDVERVGEVAQELADLLRLHAFYLAASTHSYYQWEDDQNGNRLIEAIHPEIGRVGTAYSWHCLTESDDQCTPPEAALDRDELADATEQ